MQITAAVARSGRSTFSLEAVELDPPRDDEILVRVEAVGVCHTDLIARDGVLPSLRLPAVLGHEGVGVVTRVGQAVTKVGPGDRVLMTFRSCGECARCRRGDPAYCAAMPTLNYIGCRPDGSTPFRCEDEPLSGAFFGQSSFATYALAYQRNVVGLPTDLPSELAAPLACGVQTGVGAVTRALAAEPGSSLLVLGGGTVGLSAVMGAVLQSCATIIVAEPHAARRALAEDLGATQTLSAAPDDLTAAVRAIAPLGVDHVVDTTGYPPLLEAAMGCLAPKGVLGLVGAPPPGTPLPGRIGPLLTFGQSVRGIIEGDSDPDTFIPELIAHWRAGRLPLEKLVKTFPFEHINEAIEAQHRGECVKVVLRMPDGPPHRETTTTAGRK
ncbi:MAG TPA: NAD(P)-dependent alcohol dehydrogenase [Phenylobacterium sp.]|nr:NAD(P)-dependent alcohol dehydrogenase [Phenylobacterium sp.]